MILDNAKIHHAKLIQPFLNKNSDRLELMFLPPYSPNFNRIEGLWKWLKNDVINNVFYEDVSGIRYAVQGFISKVNAQSLITIDRLCCQL